MFRASIRGLDYLKVFAKLQCFLLCSQVRSHALLGESFLQLPFERAQEAPLPLTICGFCNIRLPYLAYATWAGLAAFAVLELRSKDSHTSNRFPPNTFASTLLDRTVAGEEELWIVPIQFISRYPEQGELKCTCEGLDVPRILRPWAVLLPVKRYFLRFLNIILTYSE